MFLPFATILSITKKPLKHASTHEHTFPQQNGPSQIAEHITFKGDGVL